VRPTLGKQVLVGGVWAVEFVGLVFLVLGLALKLELVRPNVKTYAYTENETYRSHISGPSE